MLFRDQVRGGLKNEKKDLPMVADRNMDDVVHGDPGLGGRGGVSD